MKTKRDYYEILVIEKSATDDEIKKSYRKLAIQFHPDRNQGNKEAEERFKEINEAYQVLSDPRKRGAYDQFGHAGLGAQGFDPSGFSGSFTDIFDNIFGDIFGGGGGGGASSAGGGIDLRYNLEIEFEEAAFGVEKSIGFEKETVCDTCSGNGARPGTQPKACRTCRGSGQVRFNQGFFTLTRTCSTCYGRGAVVEDKCRNCRGTGRSKKPVTVSVKVPAGIDSEQRLRLRGEGEISEAGGPPGDLYVIVRVKDHPFFKREEEHIILDLPITFVQAALGAEIDVPTLGGQGKVQIPEGIQSGELLRMRGKGIKRLNGSGHGDMLVRVFVETPSNLNAKQRTLLQDFAEQSGRDAHPRIDRFVQKLKDLFAK